MKNHDVKGAPRAAPAAGSCAACACWPTKPVDESVAVREDSATPEKNTEGRAKQADDSEAKARQVYQPRDSVSQPPTFLLTPKAKRTKLKTSCTTKAQGSTDGENGLQARRKKKPDSTSDSTSDEPRRERRRKRAADGGPNCKRQTAQ